MKKIPTIFHRNRNNPSLVTDEVNPVALWVFHGEGRPTRKFDGTAVLIRDGKMFKRYDCKSGRTPPMDFEAADSPDPTTGHWPGWIPVTERPDDQYFIEAFTDWISNTGSVPTDGTYELCGPKVQNNPEKFESHNLVPHGSETLTDINTYLDSLKAYFESHDIEGIVWHHPDGRMAKIKARDFGIRRA